MKREGRGSKLSQTSRNFQAYHRFRHIDADQEYQFSNEQVDAQVLVDGVAVTLQTPEEAKGEDADGEADKGHHNPHPSDDGQKQLVPDVVPLGGVRVMCQVM